MEQKHFVFFISQAGSSCSYTARQAADSGAPQGDVLSDLCSPSTPRASDNTPLSGDCYCGTSGTERLNTKVLQTGVSSAVGSNLLQRNISGKEELVVDLKYCEPPTTISDPHGSKTNRLTAHIINNPYTTIRLTFTVYSQHVSTATDAVVRAFMFPQDELLIILMFSSSHAIIWSELLFVQYSDL